MKALPPATEAEAAAWGRGAAGAGQRSKRGLYGGGQGWRSAARDGVMNAATAPGLSTAGWSDWQVVPRWSAGGLWVVCRRSEVVSDEPRSDLVGWECQVKSDRRRSCEETARRVSVTAEV